MRGEGGVTGEGRDCMVVQRFLWPVYYIAILQENKKHCKKM